MREAFLVQAGSLALLVLVSPACRKPCPPAPGADAAVARVAGKAITRAELDARLKQDRAASREIFDIDTQRQEVLEGVLDEMINDALFAAEAKRRGLSVSQLLAAEVDAKIAPVSDAEKRAQYEGIKARVANRPVADVLREIESGLREQRVAARRAAFTEELRPKAEFAVMLDAPRMTVEVGKAAAQGPAGAPVTVVEFSDFQCPYCARAAATLRQVREKYGDRVRLAFRHFPLPPQVHPNAAKAAEAANCAAEQGRFWEMHDRLFEKQAALDVASVKRYAGELGLDQTAFARCLDSGRQQAAVQRDLAAGEELGVRGTPAFFVNGRLIRGALPFERFARMIDRELARVQPPSAPAPSAGAR